MKKLSIVLFLLIPLISFTQAGFKLRKFKDKLSSKVMEKGLEKGMGLDHFGKLAALEYENYHYRYETEIYSFTVDFNNDPREKMNSLNSNSYNTVKLTIRNKSDKDILFGSKNKRKRVDAREIEGVITMPDFQFIVIPGLSRNQPGVDQFGKEKNKDRLYAKGDPKSYSDTELSSIYINYEVIDRVETSIMELDLDGTDNGRPVTIIKNNGGFDTYFKKVEYYKDFPDEINIRYKSDVNYFWGGGFKSDERLEREGKLHYITLTANPNWSRKWRSSDTDYQKKLSDFMAQNEVSVFGKKKNKKKNKKKKK
ncbi:MAG: hypothetical protein ACJ0NM_01120 [Flavobacteriaceae bacterium]